MLYPIELSARPAPKVSIANSTVGATRAGGLPEVARGRLRQEPTVRSPPSFSGRAPGGDRGGPRPCGRPRRRGGEHSWPRDRVWPPERRGAAHGTGPQRESGRKPGSTAELSTATVEDTSLLPASSRALQDLEFRVTFPVRGRPVRLVVRTLASHAGSRGSIPLRAAIATTRPSPPLTARRQTATARTQGSLVVAGRSQ